MLLEPWEEFPWGGRAGELHEVKAYLRGKLTARRGSQDPREPHSRAEVPGRHSCDRLMATARSSHLNIFQEHSEPALSKVIPTTGFPCELIVSLIFPHASLS